MVQANHLPSCRPSQFSPILKAILRSQACITVSAVNDQSKLFPGLKCCLSLVAMVTYHVMCSYICDWFAVTFEAQDLLRFTAWLVFFFEWTVKTVFEALFYKVESVGKINSFCGNLAWDKTTIVIARAVNETTTLYTVIVFHWNAASLLFKSLAKRLAASCHTATCSEFLQAYREMNAASDSNNSANDYMLTVSILEFFSALFHGQF